MNHQHSHDKRADILEAAHRRFARFGLAKVTMDEIAADLGMSKAALYYYFPAKEDVFRHVVASEQQAFATRIEAIVVENSAASVKLREYFTQHLNLLGSLLDLGIVEARASDSVKPIMRELFREFSSTETAFLCAILRKGIRLSEFMIDSAEKSALLVQHVLQGLRILFFKTMRDREPKPADIKAYRDEVLRFLDILLIGISHSRNGVKKI
jgi:TetR/AcrR family transcriptional regulator